MRDGARGERGGVSYAVGQRTEKPEADETVARGDDTHAETITRGLADHAEHVVRKHGEAKGLKCRETAR